MERENWWVLVVDQDQSDRFRVVENQSHPSRERRIESFEGNVGLGDEELK